MLKMFRPAPVLGAASLLLAILALPPGPADAQEVPFRVNTVVQGTPADRGGIIAAGGTAQLLMAANPVRRGFAVQNQSTGALYVSGIAGPTGATTDQHSLLIPAGGYYETSSTHVSPGAVSIVGATTGQAFYAREW